MLRRILASSRYMVVIAVIGAFLASITVLIYGGVTVLTIIFDVFSHWSFTVDGAKHLAVESIEIIDLFLLGTVLYIIALGLYELFIDESLSTPSWLIIHNLDDLKEILVRVIVVLLAVTFLAEVVTWNGSITILALGLAVGIVLFALGYILTVTVKPHATEKQEEHVEKIPL